MFPPSEKEVLFTHKLALEILQDIEDLATKLKKYEVTLRQRSIGLSSSYLDMFYGRSVHINSSLFQLNVGRYRVESTLPERIIEPKNENESIT